MLSRLLAIFKPAPKLTADQINEARYRALCIERARYDASWAAYDADMLARSQRGDAARAARAALAITKPKPAPKPRVYAAARKPNRTPDQKAKDAREAARFKAAVYVANSSKVPFPHDPRMPRKPRM